MSLKKLTAQEKAIMIDRGTENPFSGKYWNNNKLGRYFCKQCGAELFNSKDQFESGCGWPSFDDECGASVKKNPDLDGKRTEIVCAKCLGHLGHIFNGENFTTKNTRYCVNSIALDFIPEQNIENLSRAYFAGGCFWGVEYFFNQALGVKSARSGYMGGKLENPDYEQVCSGRSGHIETVEVTFDPKLTNFRALGQLFFEIHNPEEVNRQGPDIGSQYASVIFYADEEQKNIAEELMQILKNKNYTVATKLIAAQKFWPAELYHQDYYGKNGKRPYCHIYTKRF